ncbi:MAG: SulP family inorganic anion transporter [Alphaproteobacteria bacterium]
MKLQKDGYGAKALVSNIALGLTDGLESALWSYVFATIVFAGALSIYVPVGLWIILAGWAVVSIFVALTSYIKIHFVSIDEQAVVILGSIGVLLAADFGADAATARGLATMLAIMAATTFAIAFMLFAAARLRFSRLLEILPYPVICGYMAGIAWLLLDAAVSISTGIPISKDLLNILLVDNNLIKLVMAVIGGLGMIAFTRGIDRAWALPAISLIIVALFYAVAFANDMSIEALVAGGWVYDVQLQSSDVPAVLLGLTWADVDIGFIVSVLPQILTIVFLTMLNSSINLSILAGENPEKPFRSTEEMAGMGGGNLLLGFIACPPGYSDAVMSIMYKKFGATTRWVMLASSFVCLVALFAGTSVISYMPNVLLCASILLFSFLMFYDWLYANVRTFTPLDYSIVCIILASVIGFGFIEGIVVGVFLTVILFVLRYSMISSVQGRYTLKDHRSSVERSTSSNLLLNRHGNEALVYTLRGFLFFGTANSVRDVIREDIANGEYEVILLNFRRVTGIDVSALNTFRHIREYCDATGVVLLISGASEEIEKKLLLCRIVSDTGLNADIFNDADYALERMEEILLAKYADENLPVSVIDHLASILGSKPKAQALFGIMERVDLAKGETLFRQGEADNGFFLLESGSMAASIEIGEGRTKRIKKFNAGSIIGEISRYLVTRERTATVAAYENAVLYHVNPTKLDGHTGNEPELLVIIHELVARTLSVRIDYMNSRLMRELP